jgi:cytochrome d ubiquinol oxidase subunit I
MPIGKIEIPAIGNEVVIVMLVVPHILIAAFIIGIVLIAATSEYVGMLTKQPKYDRFAHNASKFTVLLFATGSSLAITFILMLITLYPVFWSYMQNIFFWVLLAEAFMFVGEILLLYSWYVSWEKLGYRKRLHIAMGFMTALFLVAQMTFIDVVGSYMMTPTEGAPPTDVGWTFLNPTFMPLNMHRFVGNLSYAGFLIAGWAAWRYLRSTSEGDREYYDWMGHWGLMWGFGFLLLQPVVGFGYFKEIREHNDAAFTYLMLGDKSWLFNLLMIWLGIMSVTSVAYCLHKLKFAVTPMPTLRNMLLGALGFMAIFSLLNVIPSDGNLVPQIGLIIFGGKEAKFPLGGMYPWKYFGLIGMMLVGIFVLGLYLKAAAGGFRWGRASRWSQYALMITAVTVVLTMMTMGYARETARRATDPDGSGGSLINGCITLDQKIVPEGCGPAESRLSP